MSYYVKGSSKYDTSAAISWLAIHRAGFPSSHYLDTGWKEFNISGASEDPYWMLGGNGGERQAEFGISGSYRIRVNEGGIYGYHTASGVWLSLFGSGAFGTGVTDHGLLGGLGDDDHPRYLNTGTWNTWTGTQYNVVSGIVAQLTGAFPVVSGVVAQISGDFVNVSGDVVNLMLYSSISGEFVIVSGAFSKVSGAFSQVSGQFSTLSGNLVTLLASYSNLSGDFSTVSGLFSILYNDYSNLSGNYAILSGSYSNLSEDYVITSGDYVAFSGDFAALSTSFNTHITGLTGDSWTVFYSSGIYVTGLPLGTSGQALMSNGVNVAPTWGIPDIVNNTVYGASWNGVTTKAPSNDVVYDKINSMDTTISTNTSGIASGIKRQFSLGLNGDGGATEYSYRVVIDAVGEQVGGGFKVLDNIDASEDITITLTWYRNDGNADTVAFLLYIRAIKTDGSEANAWNIENGTAISLAACAAGRFQTYSYVIDSAYFEQGDLISIIFYDNEAGRSLHMTSLDVQYTST